MTTVRRCYAVLTAPLGCWLQSGSTPMTARNTICLWDDGGALDAATWHAQTFPDSAVGAVHRAPGDSPAATGRWSDGRNHRPRHSLRRPHWQAGVAPSRGVFRPGGDRGPGRERPPVAGDRQQRWSRKRLRLVQGPPGNLLVDHAARAHRSDRRLRPRCSEARGRRNDDPAQDQHRGDRSGQTRLIRQDVHGRWPSPPE